LTCLPILSNFGIGNDIWNGPFRKGDVHEQNNSFPSIHGSYGRNIPTACCDDDSSGRKVITEVNSIYEQGTCGDDNMGDTVYAKEQDAEYFCGKSGWTNVLKRSLTAPFFAKYMFALIKK
jgi:hypothetical protein